MKDTLCLVCEKIKATSYFHLMPVCAICYERLKGRENQRKREAKEVAKNEMH